MTIYTCVISHDEYLCDKGSHKLDKQLLFVTETADAIQALVEYQKDIIKGKVDEAVHWVDFEPLHSIADRLKVIFISSLEVLANEVCLFLPSCPVDKRKGHWTRRHYGSKLSICNRHRIPHFRFGQSSWPDKHNYQPDGEIIIGWDDTHVLTTHQHYKHPNKEMYKVWSRTTGEVIRV